MATRMLITIAILCNGAVAAEVEFQDRSVGDYRLKSIRDVEWNGGNYDVIFYPPEASPWDVPSYQSILPVRGQFPYPSDGNWPQYYKSILWGEAVNALKIPIEDVNEMTRYAGMPRQWVVNANGDELVFKGWHYRADFDGGVFHYDWAEDFGGVWTEILPVWQAGDANKDGRFDTADLVTVFTAGEYEDSLVSNSEWSEGDWNGDREFTTDDLVFALQAGEYEKAAAAVAAVPEPSAFGLLTLGLGLAFYHDKARKVPRQ